LTARHVGLFVESDWKVIVRESARALRHMFNEVDAWVSTGVKREDLRNNTAVAQRALARYAEVKRNYVAIDQDVLQGVRRATLSPVNRILEKYLSDIAAAQRMLKDIKQAAAGKVDEVNAMENMASVKVPPNFGFNKVNKRVDTKVIDEE
jgi:t-SNARE complex subunit (syntaxin)